MRIRTAEKALKGRHSKAMGLDPSTRSQIGFQALKGRNSSQAIPFGLEREMDAISPFQGLGPAGVRIPMGQDPSLCYCAPLGLCLRDLRAFVLTPTRACGISGSGVPLSLIF